MCTLETDVPLSRIQPVCVKGSRCLLPCMQCVITGIAVPVCIGVHFGALATLFKKKVRLVIHLSANHLRKLALCPENLACFGFGGDSCRLSAALVCLCGCCCFLDFPGFCKTLLTSMRVGHTGRDTAHVSKRAHCQLSLAILHARCCCFRYNGTLVAPPLCKLANSWEGAKLRASAAAAQQLSHLKATSSN